MTLILKPGRERPIVNGHYWIFSGAIASLNEEEATGLARVYTNDRKLLGTAYVNSKVKTIRARMIAWGDQSAEIAIIESLDSAHHMRETLLTDDTTAYRLVNGEGDRLPGLVIDRYADCFVIQITTLGMDRFKSLIVEWIEKTFSPRMIFEKSLSPSRKEEGLPPIQGLLKGEIVDPVEVKENGLRFNVSIPHGQKSGFFLDQRRMREEVRRLSKGRSVLNLFGYTGGFSVYALAGGALKAATLDASAGAIALAEKNISLNGFTPQPMFQQDAFEFLRSDSLEYNLIILDPPALAKKERDVIAAARGYKELNRQVFLKMPENSILITCSCSHHVDAKLFQQVVFQAASEAGRVVKIIGQHLQAEDHPVDLAHPESDYLKSLILWVGGFR